MRRKILKIFCSACNDLVAGELTFKRLGTDLLLLIGHEVRHERKEIYRRAFVTAVEDANLRVGYTTAVP